MCLESELVDASLVRSGESEVTVRINSYGVHNFAADDDINLSARCSVLDVSGDIATSLNLRTILGSQSWGIDEHLDGVTLHAINALQRIGKSGVEGKIIAGVFHTIFATAVGGVDTDSLATNQNCSTGVTLIQY